MIFYTGPFLSPVSFVCVFTNNNARKSVSIVRVNYFFHKTTNDGNSEIKSECWNNLNNIIPYNIDYRHNPSS